MSNKKRSGKAKGKRSIGKEIKLILQLLLLFFLIAIIIGMVYFYHTYGKTIFGLQSQAKQMVNASTEETFKSSQTSLVYDTEGNLISTLKSEKDVYYLEYEDIPAIVIDAMVVSEDRKFMEHDGVDYWANIRAAIALIKHKGEITQGASTITQQLARNVFLSHEVTYERKIEEIFTAQELEKKYTKFDILEFYLNEIYFANGHYGIQAAAQAYFGEGIASLSLSQTAFLCAIPNNPTIYNPLTNMDNTLERRDRILVQLLQDGKITQEQYDSAVKETIELKQETTDKKNYVETYTYYCAIRALMKQQGFEFCSRFDSEEEQKAYEKAYEELYYQYQKDLYIKGYRIYTSIDLKKQELLQDSVDDVLSDFTEKNDEGVYQMQGAAVTIDNDSGRVVAIVGGREQKLKGYTLNRGYQSYRQPGSAIKPLIVYTPAFEGGYTPASIVEDKYKKDGPKNSDGNYLGKIKLQRAIELSKNTVAWKLFEELTPAAGLSYLLKMNFAKIMESDYVPAASLGGLTIGASPVEMAAAYSTLENDGYYREPTCIVKIMDSEGNEIIGDTLETTQVYNTNAARMMTEALEGVIKKGTAKGLGLSNTVSAGKTGTTNDKKDGWFVGYTPYYTTSVWVGYDMPETVSDLKGATYPGTIWHNYMEQIHDSTMKREFELYNWRAALKKAEKEEQDNDEQEKAVTKTENQIEEETVLPEEDPAGTENTAGNASTESEAENIEEDTPEEEYPDEEYPEEENNEEYYGEDTANEDYFEGEETEDETSEEGISQEDVPQENAEGDSTTDNSVPEDTPVEEAP